MTSDLGRSFTELEVEFPTKFLMHARRVFADSVLLLNPEALVFDVAAQMYGTVGRLELRRFYEQLLDFDAQTKTPLLQLLRECSGGEEFASSWVIVLPRLPAQFCRWWENQLGTLREMGLNLLCM